jgi:cysteine sulfinate desulfinase/cysteine desulfurase-like protein
VLIAAGVEPATAAAAIRFSLSHRTTDADINYAVDRLSTVYRRMRRGEARDQ